MKRLFAVLALLACAPDTGVVSFKLSLVRGKWLVEDLDFDTEERAKEKVKAFTKKHPNAKTIPAKGKKG